MKRFALYLGIVAGLVASCSTKEKDFQTAAQDDVVFYASFEQPSDIDTRVYANEDLLLRWTEDDRVSIFEKNTYNQQFRFTGETGDNAGGFKKVGGDDYYTGNSISNIVSVYPYLETTKISDNGVLTVDLPAEQHYAESTFGLGANTMVSVSSDNFLQYKNVGGYLVLKLYGEGVFVTRLELTGNHGELLAGKASITMGTDGVPLTELVSIGSQSITLSCERPVALGGDAENSTEFWLVLPPLTFSQGLTLTVVGITGETFTKSTARTITIERNLLRRMAPIQVELEASPSVTPEPVDLALPSGIKWSNVNLGSTSPSGYGDYYAWGESEFKSDYTWETYEWANAQGDAVSLTKYNTNSIYGTLDNKTELEKEDDAVYVKLGRKWRMPTREEFDELIAYCSWTWTTENGVTGYKVRSLQNGNSIFLPAAGRRNGESIKWAGSFGYYWSSSLHSEGDTKTAYNLCFESATANRSDSPRKFGLSVRPVLNEPIRDDKQALEVVWLLYNYYSQERFYGRDLYWEQACVNDMVWGRTRSFNTLATLNYTGNESPLSSAFRGIYKRELFISNWLIRTLIEKEETDGLTEIQRRVLGEAYFFRAAYHFIVAYRYGTADLGVPFVAYEEEDNVDENSIPNQLPTVMDNYAQIVSDFMKAEDLLSRFESYGEDDLWRAHKASACAMMAKVYAYWAMWDSSKWTNVISCVDKLEQEYNRALVANYADLFSPERTIGFWNEEYCWGIAGEGGYYKGGRTSSVLTQYSYDLQNGVETPGVMLEARGWGKFNGWGQFKPTYDLYEEMAKDNDDTNGDGLCDVNDIKNGRLATTILEYNDQFVFFGETRRFYSATDIEAGFMCNKYMQAFAPKDCISRGWVMDNADWPLTSVMWPVLRFADALLLRAEAYLATGNNVAATNDINRIRRRSHLKEINGSATWSDLYHERRCELAFEFSADHAFDCKRWAVSGAPEIKVLALSELNTHPRVRHYENRSDPYSAFTVGPYDDYVTPAKQWSDKYLTFPYPSGEIEASNGHLQNPPSWR